MRSSFLWGWCGLKASTKTGIFLAWGGMSFIDAWPNINSVCDLPGLFWGNFWCWGGFVGVHCYFFFGGGGGGGGGGGFVVVVVIIFIVVVVLLVWLVVVVFWVVVVLQFLFVFCCCCCCCFLVFFCFCWSQHTQRKKQNQSLFSSVLGGPFPLFPFFVLVFLFFSLFFIFFSPFLLESLDVVYLHGCAKTTR